MGAVGPGRRGPLYCTRHRREGDVALSGGHRSAKVPAPRARAARAGDRPILGCRYISMSSLRPAAPARGVAAAAPLRWLSARIQPLPHSDWAICVRQALATASAVEAAIAAVPARPVTMESVRSR